MKRVTPLFVPKRRGVVVLLLLTMLIGSAAAVAQVWTNLRAIELGYKISKLTKRRRALLEANRRLRIEVALLKNPARIGQLARQLGLREPEPEQIHRLALPAAPAPKRHDERRRHLSPEVRAAAPAAPATATPTKPTRREPMLSAARSFWPTASRQEAAR